jgi:hypothetical protein
MYILMRIQNRKLWLLTFIFIFAGGTRALAQTSPSPAGKDKGLVLYEDFEGSSNSDGQVMAFSSSATYHLNSHYSAGVGIPIYFDRASSSNTGTTSSSGIGNAFFMLRAAWKHPVVNYGTSLLATVPTGDSNKGLSTGHATFDWDNRFDRDISRFTPFIDMGLANSITDTRFFKRPFVSYGDLAHFEAGTDVDLSHSLSLTLSAYDIAPWGAQTVTSRLIARGAAGNPGSVKHGRIFENSHQTVGTATLTRDDGYTASLSFSPKPYLDLSAGYSRSVDFALNTVSFGIGVNLSSLFGKTTVANQ